MSHLWQQVACAYCSGFTDKHIGPPCISNHQSNKLEHITETKLYSEEDCVKSALIFFNDRIVNSVEQREKTSGHADILNSVLNRKEISLCTSC